MKFSAFILLCSAVLSPALFASTSVDERLASKTSNTSTLKADVEARSIALGKQGVAVTKSNGNADIAKLVSNAETRQQKLLALFRKDPQAAVNAILPADVRSQLPTEIQPYLAQYGELEGKLLLVNEDSEDGTHRIRYFISNDKNDNIELAVSASQQQALKSGMNVKVKGWQFKNTEQQVSAVAVADDSDSLQVLAATDNTTTADPVTSSGVLSGTTGDQKLLVLLLNFQDNPTVQPWTIAEVQQMVFGTINQYYQEASYGQTSLSGDVKGYYTLPVDTNCDYMSLDAYAQQAATDNGIDLSQYQRLVYIFPQNSTCGWRGQGTIGGSPSRAWINGEMNLLTIGHELGHNLGLKHAKELSCGSGYLSDSCIAITYGDTLDIMGKSEGHFNLFNKERLGWLTSADIVQADTDGSYQITPYETARDGQPKGLKVRRGTDSLTGDALWYYLEYRQPIGFDAFLAGKADTQGVLVHLNESANDIESSELLDMTPQSSLFDLDDAALAAGKSYNDSAAGVTITTESVSSSDASVYVTYQGSSCVRSQPLVTVTPGSSDWVTAGSSVAYSVTVTNSDSLECSDSSFTVSTALPTGWQQTAQTLTLSPGQSNTVTLNVTSAATAADGYYDLPISATATNDGAEYSNSQTVSYVIATIANTCTASTPGWSLQTATSGEVEAGTAVTYQGIISNLDSDGCDASTFDVAAQVPAGWSATTASVTLQPGEQQSVAVQVASPLTANDGTYDFSMTTSSETDSTLQSSASASYIISSPQATCNELAPTIVVTGGGTSVAAGTQQTYTVKVSNGNDSSCDNMSYAISATVPAGWQAGSASITLASGTTQTLSLVVTSATDTSAGDYSLTFTASNTATGISNSAVTSYSVAQAANTAPVAVDDSVSISSKVAVDVSVLQNDTDADGDALSIVSFTQGAKGSVAMSADGVLRYTPSKSFKSSDSFSYTITDGQSSSTATVTVTLSSTSDTTTSTSKGKGKP
ncbi:cadherin-like domain-containing protein [Shewanella yunxiaonensis]|uniref:Cadherin-like domain-containing protein n=1 Tax=Shewanella yunxiaonensis TaxID=2829809 RepID=A0ABX7YWB3_9GAMM|nr:Ig-like domain-containing protein [Shewanella yunxiaonensis]QUN07059.1 cadherin-like domain-containing protein [Shewanella yunxiaonensis]